jgi:hypothetical protein
MAKKNGIPRSRIRKYVLNHPCGCYFCCGNLDQEYKKRKLKILKHKLKNWIE